MPRHVDRGLTALRDEPETRSPAATSRQSGSTAPVTPRAAYGHAHVLLAAASALAVRGSAGRAPTRVEASSSFGGERGTRRVLRAESYVDRHHRRERGARPARGGECHVDRYGGLISSGGSPAASAPLRGLFVRTTVHERRDQPGELVGLIDHRERSRLGDHLEPRIGQRRREPLAIIEREERVVLRPRDQGRLGEARQTFGGSDCCRLVQRGGQPSQIVAYVCIGQRGRAATR